MDDILKTETRTVFDRDKIRRGDVIKFTYRTYHDHIPFKTVTKVLWGLVHTVLDTELTITVESADHVGKPIIFVDESDRILELIHQEV